MKLRKRYSEFDRLRKNIVRTFPQSEGSLPPLPPKSIICKFFDVLKRGKRAHLTAVIPAKFQPKFLEKRRQGLSYFLRFVCSRRQSGGIAS